MCGRLRVGKELLSRRSLVGADCMSSSTNEATHPRCSIEGCPDRPGRASYMEGESWGIIAKLSSELIRRNRVMP